MTDRTTASITLADNSQRIDFAAGCPSLLHCLESNKIDAAYQCREGYCGACRATLVSGEVNYNEERLFAMVKYFCVAANQMVISVLI